MQKITYDEFLRALEKTPRNWYIRRGDDAIRFNGDASKLTSGLTMCPANVVLCSVLGAGSHISWADWSGDVADAADNKTEMKSEIRVDLLAACGLSEDIDRPTDRPTK